MITPGACLCELAGEALELLPGKAVYWAACETLLVADVHLGKSAAFRAAGLGVPEATGEDLFRLGEQVDATAAKKLVVLGDLFHAPEGLGQTVSRCLLDWCAARAGLEIVVTRGNHDRECGALLAECGVEFVDTHRMPPFQFEHEVDPGLRIEGDYRLGGHVHPAVRLPDRTRSFRLPCFWFGRDAGVLPAFGGFTGTHVVERVKGDRVYAVAEDRVVAVGA